MTQITVRLPDELTALLDSAAKKLEKSRADVIRAAIEHYLDDYEDLAVFELAFIE